MAGALYPQHDLHLGTDLNTGSEVALRFARRVVARFIDAGGTSAQLPIIWSEHEAALIPSSVTSVQREYRHLTFDCVNEILMELYPQKPEQLPYVFLCLTNARLYMLYENLICSRRFCSSHGI